MRKTQKLLQGIFFVLFIILTAMGKVQLWAGVFGIGLLLSIWFGRLYCGWICPIHTGMGIVGRLTGIRGAAGGKHSVRSKGLSSLSRRSDRGLQVLRIGGLVALVAAFMLMKLTGKQLPVLLIIFFAGLGSAFVMPPALWHRWICPYGTLLSLFSRKAGRGLRLDQKACNSCGLCVKKCPAEAIRSQEQGLVIERHECLECRACVDACRRGAIHL